MTKTKLVSGLVGLLVGVVLVFGVNYFSASLFGGAGIGPTHYQTENFLQGLYGGTAGQFNVTNAGAITASTGTISTLVATTSLTTNSLVVGAGTAITGRNCTTTAWYPEAVVSTTVALKDVTLPSGYAVGDELNVSLNTSTQGLLLNVFPTGTAGTAVTAILATPNFNFASVDLGTTTVKVCYTK